MTFRKIKNVFFVGIGGIGMSGIAELLLNLGFNVSGSDINENENVTRLKNLNIDVKIGHSPSNINQDTDVLVYSSAIPIENPEIVRARQKGIPIIRRAEMLGELISVKETSIAVSGTHGKTTTSFMISKIFQSVGKDIGFLIGGISPNFEFSAKLGTDEVFVVEADEYDSAFFDKRSKFIHYHPDILLINNLEFDHADIFRDVEDIKKQFTNLLNIMRDDAKVIRFSISPGIDTDPINPHIDDIIGTVSYTHLTLPTNREV